MKSESKEHSLKAWPEYFRKVFTGIKTFEVRENDRDFKVGDTLKLMEYSPRSKMYTGNFMFVGVTDITSSGPCVPLADGYVIMSIRKMKEANKDQHKTNRERFEAEMQAMHDGWS